MSYQKEYQASVDNPEQFWADKADAIAWFKKPETILSEDANGMQRWYADGELNTCYLALDYHVEQGRGGKTALIYDSPVTHQKAQYTYQEMLDKVAQLAGYMAGQGVAKGDTVLIYMPMIPEATFAMLACARLGAVHSVVFGGFAANELAVRIDDAKPKLVLSASCGIEPSRIVEYKPLLDEAIALADHKPKQQLIFQREQLIANLDKAGDCDWQQAVDSAKTVDCVSVKAIDPLYVLYTSGTTGIPKGIVRDNGGHAVAMKYSMQRTYSCNALK